MKAAAGPGAAGRGGAGALPGGGGVCGWLAGLRAGGAVGGRQGAGMGSFNQ